MARFQALTNKVLDLELEMLRERLGLEPNQKADLLREVVALAAWVFRQAELGRTIEGRRGDEVEPLTHPVVERLRTRSRRPVGERLVLSAAEAHRLASVLDRGFDPPPALRKALSNLASRRRHPPKLRWKKTAA
jgi:hypothetical protein